MTTKQGMRPTSQAQYESSRSGLLPPLERVRDDLWVLPTLMPSSFPAYVFSYLALDAEGGVHVIDAGFDSDENWELLVSALATIGRPIAEVRSVTATHLHRDHLGMALRLRDASGASVALHSAEQAALDLMAADDRDVLHISVLTADLLLEDGDRLDIPGWDLRVVHTPGHTPGHSCLHDAGHDVLFSGDHVLPNIYPGVGLGGPTDGNPLADYLASLDRVVALGEPEVCPGHGYRFAGLADRCASIAAHHRKRTDEVAAVLETAPTATVAEIASRLSWTAGWDNLHGLYLRSALAQTAMHIELLGHETRS